MHVFAYSEQHVLRGEPGRSARPIWWLLRPCRVHSALPSLSCVRTGSQRGRGGSFPMWSVRTAARAAPGAVLTGTCQGVFCFIVLRFTRRGSQYLYNCKTISESPHNILCASIATTTTGLPVLGEGLVHRAYGDSRARSHS